LRRRIRIGIQNVANRGRNEERRRDHERAPNLPERVQEDDEPPQCRICMSDVNDENSELGKLFSPCMCKGSVGLVHRKCLDRWRTLSSNPRSYFSCDQCKYDYNLERTEYAKWLEREELPNIFAVLATFLLALTIGVALRTISFALVQILTFMATACFRKPPSPAGYVLKVNTTSTWKISSTVPSCGSLRGARNVYDSSCSKTNNSPRHEA